VCLAAQYEKEGMRRASRERKKQRSAEADSRWWWKALLSGGKKQSCALPRKMIVQRSFRKGTLFHKFHPKGGERAP